MQQLGRRSDGRDDLVTHLLDQAHKALAHDRGILGYD
jgi:hypothetical protein